MNKRSKKETDYLESVYALIEGINLQELGDSSKFLIRDYIEGAGARTAIECARIAVERHTQTDLPSLQSIREKAKHASLSELDHLILKMEWAAKELEEFL